MVEQIRLLRAVRPFPRPGSRAAVFVDTLQSTCVAVLAASVVASLADCGATPTRSSAFSTITIKSSWDCLHEDKTAITDCEIEGKLVLTDPSWNLTYALYRKKDEERLRY